MNLIPIYGTLPISLQKKNPLEVILRMAEENEEMMAQLRNFSLSKEKLVCEDCTGSYSVAEAYVLRLFENYFRMIGLEPIIGPRCTKCYSDRREEALTVSAPLPVARG